MGDVEYLQRYLYMYFCVLISLIGANVVFSCMTDIVSKPVVMIRQLIVKMRPAWQYFQRK